MLPGHASAAGTTRYRDRFPQLRDAGHFRHPGLVPGAADLWLSSMGLGTYLGEPDDAADREYTEAATAALLSGINVLDAAINYRHQRSERNIGAAMTKLIEAGDLQRDEVLVCTKAGFLAFDGNLPADPRAYFLREYVEPGILDPRQIVGGMHCMSPGYLQNQIERSRRNLGLETIDVFYMHNPETQLSEISRDVFCQRMRDAFSMLEAEVAAGRLRYYGTATWNGYRVPPTARDYLNLFELSDLAREVGGEQHHFRFVQLPFNLGMTEAYSAGNQSSANHPVSLLSAAAQLGIAVVGSATLFQGRLHGVPPAIREVLGTQDDFDTAIQFARSAPGIMTALIGMGHAEHVAENLKVAVAPPTSADQWERLFPR